MKISYIHTRDSYITECNKPSKYLNIIEKNHWINHIVFFDFDDNYENDYLELKSFCRMLKTGKRKLVKKTEHWTTALFLESENDLMLVKLRFEHNRKYSK